MNKKTTNYFSKGEIALWLGSALLIVIFFIMFDGESYITLVSSLIGVTSLIFCAKGNPAGQVLMIIFSLLYGFIAFTAAYYGEMITYLGMTLPMAVISLISWLRNPYKGNRSEVAIGRISVRETGLMLVLSVAVTFIFYFILKAFGTANLIPGTISVTTSFIAAYLTFRRIPAFALAYAANDVVLIVLWILAAMEDIAYLSVIVCFVVFLLNDLYGFSNWQKMKKRQQI